VFLDLYYNYDLHQFVSTPTRLDSLLDLVFCNDHNCVFNPRSVDPFSTSDHNQVRFDIPLATAQKCVGLPALSALITILSMLIGSE
jgi:hypothetical protein